MQPLHADLRRMLVIDQFAITAALKKIDPRFDRISRSCSP